MERAIDLADPHDGAEDRITAFLHAHREELDSTFDALVGMFRHLAVPLESPNDNSTNSNSTPGAANVFSNDVATLPPGTRVNGVAGRLGDTSTTRETAEDEPDAIPHHGHNPPTSISWVTAVRLREGERAARRQMSTSGMHTTAAIVDDSEEGDTTLLSQTPQTTFTPLTVSYRRGIPIGSENRNGSDSATEALSNDSSEGTSSSVASQTHSTVTRHVFQLPFVIDDSLVARLQTAGGLTLPRFGSTTFATRTRIERN